MIPNDAAIYVGLLLSVPAAVSLGGIGVGLILLALVLRCGVDEACRLDWQTANQALRQFGSDDINTVPWTAEKLNQAFAKYPLLPENSPPSK